MSTPQTLDFAKIVRLFSAEGVYVIAYSWLFGMSLWVSFFGGVIAYKTLPRQQFGNLQHRTFPIYFVSSIALSSVLLGLWSYFHPTVLNNLTSPFDVDVAQFYTIASVLLFQGLNYFVVGPLTSKTMFQRHKLEKQEGKTYDAAGVSGEMKAINRRFAQLHGWSSLANLFSVFSLIFHGLWIGNAGLKGI